MTKKFYDIQVSIPSKTKHLSFKQLYQTNQKSHEINYELSVNWHECYWLYAQHYVCLLQIFPEKPAIFGWTVKSHPL
jgi:hypothetical protein